MWRPCLGFVLAVLLGGGSAFAQSVPRAPSIAERMATLHAELPALLKSEDPIEQAWGAWVAGRDGLRHAGPLLEWLVDRQLTRSAWDWRAARALPYSLDALVVLGAPVSPALVDRIVARDPAIGLVLAARAPEHESDETLLAILRQRDTSWFAAANLLLPRRPPGLAAALIDDLHVRALLDVTAPGSHGAWGGLSGGSTCCTGSGPPSDPSFPPLPFHDLTATPTPGATLLVRGPVDVWHRRRLTDAPACPGAGPSTAQRLAYVSALLDRERLPLDAEVRRTIVWRPGVDIEAERAFFHDTVTWRHRQLLALLVDAELLTTEEASAAPLAVVVETHDLRPDRR
jgi:hypothetical protein